MTGPTASGKTPLGDLLASRGVDGRRCLHFDFGRELRTISASLGEGTVFTKEETHYIKDVLKEGRLLENERFYLAKKIFTSFVNGKNVGEKDIIVLNGLPRHSGQAEGMEDIVSIETVVVLTCSADAVLRRIRENTGGDRKERVDDDFELVKKKLEIYNNRTAPLIDFYRTQGKRILPIAVAPLSTPSIVYNKFLAQYIDRPVSIQ